MRYNKSKIGFLYNHYRTYEEEDEEWDEPVSEDDSSDASLYSRTKKRVADSVTDYYDNKKRAIGERTDAIKDSLKNTRVGRAASTTTNKISNGSSAVRNNANDISNDFRKVGQAMGSAINKASDTSSDAKDLGKILIGIFFKIILGVFVVLLILAGLLMISVSLYSAHRENCAEFTQDGLQGWQALIVDYSNPKFRSCVMNNTFNNVEVVAEKVDMMNYIMNFMNKQIYKATGDYYFANVDENSQPVGVFIEDFNIDNRYYTDETISVSSVLRVSTLDTRLSGIIGCSIDSIPYDYMMPQNDLIRVDKSSNRKVICAFKPHIFKKTNNDRDFRMSVMFNYSTQAYMAPYLMKYSLWYNLSEAQKQKVESKARLNSFKSTNAPVQIGGMLGSGDSSIIKLDDFFEESKIDVPFEFTFHANKQKGGWDEGKVHEIKKFVVTLPEGLTLKGDAEGSASDELIYGCFGYAFRKSNDCDDVFDYLGEKKSDDSPLNYLCREGEHVYMLDPSKGKGLKLRSFKDFKTLECGITGDTEKLFSMVDNSNDDSDSESNVNVHSLGIAQVGIKLYTKYQYEVAEERSINIVKRSEDDSLEDLNTQICSDSLTSNVDENDKIDSGDASYYSEFIQHIFQANIPEDLARDEEARFEALMAAISTKYTSGFDLDNNDNDKDGYIDFVTGCTKKLKKDDDYDAEAECLANQLETILVDNLKDIERTLGAYYDDNKDIYSDDDLRADVDDYNKWLGLLCEVYELEEQVDDSDKKVDGSGDSGDDVPQESDSEPNSQDDDNNDDDNNGVDVDSSTIPSVQSTSYDYGSRNIGESCSNDNECKSYNCVIVGSSEYGSCGPCIKGQCPFESNCMENGYCGVAG